MVLGFGASRLHCPPQSCQSTAMGRDCATDSAQCCHLWLFPPELTVWTHYWHDQPYADSLLCPFLDTWHVSDLTHWLHLLQYPLSTGSCVCVCVCARVCQTWASTFVSYCGSLGCLEGVLIILNVEQKMRLLSCQQVPIALINSAWFYDMLLELKI